MTTLLNVTTGNIAEIENSIERTSRGATGNTPQYYVLILGRRHRDTYGNTYHRVEVYINNLFVGRVPREYGYGDSYIQTAHALLQHALPDLYPTTNTRLTSGTDADYYRFINDMRNYPDKYLTIVSDVRVEGEL